jgi:hypothetical protein
MPMPTLYSTFSRAKKSYFVGETRQDKIKKDWEEEEEARGAVR